MIRDHAAGVNARDPSPPDPIDPDRLADQYTAAPTLAALCDLGTSRTGRGGYAPTPHCRSATPAEARRDLTRLSDLYDAHQAARGGPRRVVRR